MLGATPDMFTSLFQLGDEVFTRQEALRAGISDELLTAACRRSVIIRLCRGAYVRAGVRTKEEHRRLLARAALRLYPDAVLASGTAVAAHGVPTFEIPVVRTDIVRPIARESLTQHLRIRPDRAGSTRTAWGPATPLAMALVRMTMDHGVTSGVASIDAALHAGQVTEGELEELRGVVCGWPRSSRFTCALAWSDGRAESLGESVTRVILRGAGWETESQVRIVDRGIVIGRADLGLVGTNVLLEFDGKVKYADGGPDALFREKKREDRIRALGYVVIRVTWDDLFHPERIIAAVRAALAISA